MFFIRGKNEHVLCSKCKAYNGPFAKCRCQLKDPKKFSCDCNGAEKSNKKFSFFYIYTLEIDWKTAKDLGDKRHQRVNVIADVNIEDNPFLHCVVSIHDKYYNLSRAEAIEIIGPTWHQYHVTKHGTPTEWCYCEELAYLEDFK